MVLESVTDASAAEIEADAEVETDAEIVLAATGSSESTTAKGETTELVAAGMDELVAEAERLVSTEALVAATLYGADAELESVLLCKVMCEAGIGMV